MKTFYFYGASDDLVEVDGAESHEHNVVGRQAGSFTLTTPDGRGARIHIRLEDIGCWSAGMSPLDEDVTVPDEWEFRVTQPNADGSAPTYSAVLIATVDDDTVLTWEDD